MVLMDARPHGLLLTLLCGLFAWCAATAEPASDLQSLPGAQLVPTEWADGDSFLVRLPDGSEHTLRLYGADCFEWHISDDADAKRLREQRRYFGIFDHGGSPAASIALAKSLGEAAATEVRARLAQPFTVHTAFADARGDGRYKRYYAFITTADGEDLALTLVRKGLARAYGVLHTTPGGVTQDCYREELRDAELIAARTGVGAWAYTDWGALSAQRGIQRSEDTDDAMAQGKAPPLAPVDLNAAARDELMQLPGIGEVTANAIIEARPFRSVEDLGRVRGIGPKRLEGLRPLVKVLP